MGNGICLRLDAGHITTDFPYSIHLADTCISWAKIHLCLSRSGSKVVVYDGANAKSCRTDILLCISPPSYKVNLIKFDKTILDYFYSKVVRLYIHMAGFFLLITTSSLTY